MHILSDPQAEQSVFNMHTKWTSLVPGVYEAYLGLVRALKITGVAWTGNGSSSNRNSHGGSHSPWKKGEKALSLMLTCGEKPSFPFIPGGWSCGICTNINSSAWRAKRGTICAQPVNISVSYYKNKV